MGDPSGEDPSGERKRAKVGVASATKALADKLVRASSYVIRDRVPFDSSRCRG